MNGTILGIDIGSVTISIVRMDRSGNILDTRYIIHHGQLRKQLKEAGRQTDLSDVRGIACCSLPRLDPAVVRMFDPQTVAIKAVKRMCSQARSLLVVGAEKFYVIRFGREGLFESIRSNSSCAAGTGSFLDQQAFRLHLSGIESLCEKALQNRDTVPDIASRCSVFAKTDLIHAQQRGYSLEAICDGLCKGLAKNIIDTLFSQEPPEAPLFLAGGVALNPAVVKYLEQQLKLPVIRDPHSHLAGALGACWAMLDEQTVPEQIEIRSLEEVLLPDEAEKSYFHPPLEMKLSDYPDFGSVDFWRFNPVVSSHAVEVEVDQYIPLPEKEGSAVFLGIDIGSTSTKAILINPEARPVAGFYTYTSGSPVAAVQGILEAMDDFYRRKKVRFSFSGVGTTGSGRKFIGKIIRADQVLDEITTHARAAFELNPETDTIIEIGGQDSKFTLMRDGTVTFTQMNAVCAAGTGSFIEEQARKMDCSLAEYSGRTERIAAPLASDRCTVFMERDTIHLLNEGYSREEILATTLHSVMENYLKKVGQERLMGDHICFQGATARNRSLVAAFEQRLGKKIFVSPYCHLTGALGAALLVRENAHVPSGFRGLELYREHIEIRSEQCTLCTNHCHISLTTVQGEQEAYGFLCGRDYETRRHVDPAPGVFDLMKERARIRRKYNKHIPGKGATIGLPATLHLFEELVLWKRFFAELSITAISSEEFHDPVRSGKRIAGAEFCAPIDSLYGHVAYLAGKTDYIFLPVSLQARNKPVNADRNYCYYTQYSASLIQTLQDKRIPGKLIAPMLDYTKGDGHVIRQLAKALASLPGIKIVRNEVRMAYLAALDQYQRYRRELQLLFEQSFKPEGPVSVLLLGRPYQVLTRSMHKGIPDMLARMGIDAYFQDMLSALTIPGEETPGETQHIPWYFAAGILEAVNRVIATPNLYPVFVTAFKCAPDAFILDFFRKQMDKHRKPYLILQIDEHDSNVGYETRIEAAIRSFTSHASLNQEPPADISLQYLPKLESQINGKTLLFPNWDSLVAPLLVANLNRSGIDARLLRSSDLSIRKSMAYNTGQCLPVNIIAQEFIDYIETHNLKPEQTILWMVRSFISCNLRLYPHHLKHLLESYGHGFERASVYTGMITHLEIEIGAGYRAYFAYLLGGLIRKTGCRIRPYEIHPGETDQAIERSIRILEVAFRGQRPLDEAVREVVALFNGIGRVEGKRPGVAIFGDLYVRDNDVLNQDLIHTIEAGGGEAITTPYTDLVKITFANQIRRVLARRDYAEAALYKALLSGLRVAEDRYYRSFRRFLGPKPTVDPKRLERHLPKFRVSPYHSGESFENLLKIFYILENYPNISLFVQTNPAFCCPALVTEAMTREIKRVTGIPVVTLTYDGTSGDKNGVIRPFLIPAG